MIDDFLNDYDLIGKTKDEIHSLLGPPTDSAYFKDEKNIVYYLGPERGLMSIDSEWFVIWFDESGKVAKHEILRD